MKVKKNKASTASKPNNHQATVTSL